MEKFRTFSSIAVPLKRSNVDTDQIIPAEFLKRISKYGFEDALFYAWRQDSDFFLNNPFYKDAKILVAGSDFGTGSSREHAVWALRDAGFKVILSSKFADIFRGNSSKQGLLAAVIDQKDIETIWEILDKKPSEKITVNLENQTVEIQSKIFNFEIDSDAKYRLLEGLDDISLTLKNEEAISEFEKKRPTWMPKTLPILE